MTSQQALDAKAELLGRLRGLLANLPRDEFGEAHALAITAAYRRVDRVLVAELRALPRTPESSS